MRGYPTRYVVFDTETKSSNPSSIHATEELTFQLGVAKVHETTPLCGPVDDYCRFTEVRHFHDRIAAMPNTREKIWIFAHNAGFDLRIIEFFRYLTDGWYHLWNPMSQQPADKLREPLLIMENPPLIIGVWRPDGQEILICDTYQWIAHSLAAIGENLGFPKGDDPGQDAPLSVRMDYCQRDVDVLDLALNRIWDWLKRNNISGFHPTRAGQSKKIYTEKYEHKRIDYNTTPAADTLARSAYYGGQTDLYYVGTVEGPIYQLDVNSLYPYVMHEKWFPTALKAHKYFPGKTHQISHSLGKCSIAEVLLDTTERAYPVRCREGTVFCRGKVRTTLAGPELQAAVLAGDVVGVLELAQYSTGAIFREFVADYWGMRCEAKAANDKVQDMIVKLLMNSLYGKFGQQTSDWYYHDSGMPLGTYGQGIVADSSREDDVKFRVLDGRVYHNREKGEAKGSFVAIAAFVTAFAREHMRALKSIVGEHNYFYQATDSLYVNEQGFNNLKLAEELNNSRLGMLKHEHTYSQITFTNIHHLDKDGAKVRGSVRGKSLDLGNDNFVVQSWESFRTAVFNGHLSEVFIRKVSKTLNGNYNRGLIGIDHWTRPWKIDNWSIPIDVQRRQPIHPLPDDGVE